MFCSQCGHSNPENAAFCLACGKPLKQDVIPAPSEDSGVQAESSFSQPAYMPPPYPPQGDANQPPYPPQGVYSGMPCQHMPTAKKRTGLIAGLILGAVLLAAAAVVMFVWPGVLVPKAPAVGGFWVSEDRGEALEFKYSGNVRVYSVNAAFKGQYQYDVTKGMGVLIVEDKTYAFAMTNDGIKVKGMGVYEKAEDDFDVDAFIDDVAGAVSVTAQPPSETETAAIPLPEPEETVSSEVGQGGDITGLWYETTGYGGTLEFSTDGTYMMTMLELSFGGTYAFDAASASWILHDELSGTTYTVTLTDGYLTMDTLQYTRDYVEPIDLGLNDTN